MMTTLPTTQIKNAPISTADDKPVIKSSGWLLKQRRWSTVMGFLVVVFVCCLIFYVKDDEEIIVEIESGASTIEKATNNNESDESMNDWTLTSSSEQPNPSIDIVIEDSNQTAKSNRTEPSSGMMSQEDHDDDDDDDTKTEASPLTDAAAIVNITSQNNDTNWQLEKENMTINEPHLQGDPNENVELLVAAGGTGSSDSNETIATESSPSPMISQPEENNNNTSTDEQQPLETKDDEAVTSTTQREDNDATNNNNPIEDTPTSDNKNKNTPLLYEGQDYPFEEPFVVFGSIQYRRVCAQVGLSSVLCMTVRFPWPVKPQDPKFDYPRPYDDRFDSSRKHEIINGDNCVREMMTTTSWNETANNGDRPPMDDQVKYCLDQTAAGSTDLHTAIFFRERHGKMTIVVRGGPAYANSVMEMFDGNFILVFGDSTTPQTIHCMSQSFRNCQNSPLESRGQGSYYCGTKEDEKQNHHALDRRKLLKMDLLDYSENINIYVVAYYGSSNRAHRLFHRSPTLDIADLIKSNGIQLKKGEMKDLTIVVAYPFAHTQTEPMIYNDWDGLVDLHQTFAKHVMSVQSDEGRKNLTELGFNLKYLFVFDGNPQYFPTATGATYAIPAPNTEAEFLSSGGYDPMEAQPPWIPEYGSKCRGPLPTTGRLREVSRLARDAFQDLGLDMRFYIRNWEFTNQLWFTTIHADPWGRKGHDCTHVPGGCAQSYVFQAAVDDYYDNLHHAP